MSDTFSDSGKEHRCYNSLLSLESSSSSCPDYMEQTQHRGKSPGLGVRKSVSLQNYNLGSTFAHWTPQIPPL